MKNIYKSTRRYSHPQRDTKLKKNLIEREKAKAKRKRCRELNIHSEMCKNCSMAEICNVEATQEWLGDRKEPE